MQKIWKSRVFQSLISIYILALLYLAFIQLYLSFQAYSKHISLSDEQLVNQSFLIRNIKARRNASLIRNITSRRNSSLIRNITTRRKPILYLHAGPYKTATSFLQCLLSRSVYKFLEMDNITYLGTCPSETACRRLPTKNDIDLIPYCEKHNSRSFFEGSSIISPSLQKELHKIYQRDYQDALIVYEYLSDLSPQRAESLLSATKEWDIRLILNYRRLFEWLPSWYSQKHKHGMDRKQYNVWPGQVVKFTKHADRKVVNLTKRAGLNRKVVGAHRYPFDMYTHEQLQEMDLNSVYKKSAQQVERTKLHPSEVARRYWKNKLGIQNVTIVDMHHYPQQLIMTSDPNADPLLVHLFCSVIPTLHTCLAARENRIELIDEGRNERFDENYDLLAIHAHQRGLHPQGKKNQRRQVVRRKIKKYHEQLMSNESHNAAPFPLKCISNRSIETLYHYSVITESTLLSGYEDDLKEQFERAVMKRSFCSIDTEKTLEMEQWKNFFQP